MSLICEGIVSIITSQEYVLGTELLSEFQVPARTTGILLSSRRVGVYCT